MSGRSRLLANSRRYAWILLPAFVGALLGAFVDPSGLPFVGRSHLTAVSFLDGQTYFGRIEANPFSDQIVMHDVYYFQSAQNTTTNTAVGMVKRGLEVHAPLDTMRISRDKVLLIETIGRNSQVANAIETDLALRLGR